jgi:DNA-binding NarL/FixJ family response regulator
MSITVLLVDDHTIVREGLRCLLEAQKDIHVVGEAGSGGEAVLCAGRLSPDIAIMDIAMPDMNGIEATRRIGETCPACRVIVLSMHRRQSTCTRRRAPALAATCSKSGADWSMPSRRFTPANGT